LLWICAVKFGFLLPKVQFFNDQGFPDLLA
jgi:hypothetical protein